MSGNPRAAFASAEPGKPRILYDESAKADKSCRDRKPSWRKASRGSTAHSRASGSDAALFFREGFCYGRATECPKAASTEEA